MAYEGTSSCVSFPAATDVLVEILRWLPPNSRRRSRLVCRWWRDAVDERTATDLQSRAKTLLVTSTYTYVAYENWRLKTVMTSLEDRIMEVVGTCNGLICLCDDSKPGGAIALANPTNGERLVLPPLPCPDILVRGRLSWHKAYGFAQHPRTGRYMVVHVPCYFDRVWEFHTVQVFTLGETSWRDAATPTVGGAGVRCLLSAGIVGVDGAVYWITDGTERIMSFDLVEEHVTSVQPLPVPLPARSGSSFHLAEVYGRLGVAIFHDSAKLAKTDVWVLESARGDQRWRRWYCVEVSVQPRRWYSGEVSVQTPQ
jgi:F-box interacting protein